MTGWKLADIFVALRLDGAKEAEQQLERFAGSVEQHTEGLKALALGLGAAGAALTGFATGAVIAATNSEKLRQRLNALFGSADAGAAVLDHLKTIARRTGTATAELAQGVTALNVYFADSPGLVYELIGPLNDLAKFMGVDLVTAVNMFGRAMTGSVSDTVAMRGPMLALVKQFAEAKYGIRDLSEVELPKFRQMLLEFIKDPTAKFADYAARSTETFAGQLDKLKIVTGQLLSSIGKELLPILTKFTEKLTQIVDYIRQMPDWAKTVTAWGSALSGALLVGTSAAASLLVKLRRILRLLTSLQNLLTGAGGIAGMGLIAALGALAAAFAAVDRSSRGAGGAARAIAGGQGTETPEQMIARFDYLSEQVRRKLAQGYSRNSAVVQAFMRELMDLRQRISELGLTSIEAVEVAGQGVAEVIDKTRRKFDQWEFEDWLFRQKAAELRAEADEAALRRTLGLDKPEPTWEERLFSDISPETLRLWREGWKTLPKPIEEVKNKMHELTLLTADLGDAVGRLFGAMIQGAKETTEQIVKLIVKLLIVKALSIIPGWGGFLSGVAGGLLGAFGFDDPEMDLKAYKWGADFAKHFRAGMGRFGQALAPGAPLRLSPQPVVVHVHEPSPRTYVEVVKAGIRHASEADRLDFFREGLGRAGQEWSRL